MRLTLMKSKIHMARLTETCLYYEGSIGVDTDIMDAANILPHEKVAIWNVTNGARLETYALPEERGSRKFLLNGAAARLGAVGDVVIIVSFADMEEADARDHHPTVLLMNEHNEIVERK